MNWNSIYYIYNSIYLVYTVILSNELESVPSFSVVLISWCKTIYFLNVCYNSVLKPSGPGVFLVKGFNY